MANDQSGIIQTFTTDVTSTQKFHVPRGGVIGLDLVRTAGTGTIALQFSLDGTTYVPARDDEGALISASLDGTTQHYSKRILAQVDTYYQLVSTSVVSGSGSISAKLTRIRAEF